MGNYAVIVDGKVQNVIVCDSKQLAEILTGETCIEYDLAETANAPHVGKSYNARTKVFEQPVLEEWTPLPDDLQTEIDPETGLIRIIE
jgi:hypothetical protein